MEKYEKFHGLEIASVHIFCLDLCDFDNCLAHMMIREVTSDLSDDGFREIFALDDLPENRDEWERHLLKKNRGWLLSAYLMNPVNVKFENGCEVKSYECSSAYIRIFAYADTLEKALDEMARRAGVAREKIFERERRRQALKNNFN
jgi:hypothetical protein